LPSYRLREKHGKVDQTAQGERFEGGFNTKQTVFFGGKVVFKFSVP
jgi:hypothetical protein